MKLTYCPMGIFACSDLGIVTTKKLVVLSKTYEIFVIFKKEGVIVQFKVGLRLVKAVTF
jgi:hypothetical protein